MTTVTVTQPAAMTPKVSLLVSTWLVAKRALLTYARTPQLVVLGTVQLAGTMLTFRFVFGGAIGPSHGLSYVDFGVPGFITAGILFTVMGTAIAMAEDLQSGLIDRMRSLPMPRSSVLIGRVIADTGVLAWSLGVTAALGFAIGFRLHGTALQGLGAFGLCLVFGFAFSWVFIALGLLAGNAKAAQGMTMLVFPVTFLSNAYVPAQTMPGWLRGFAQHQPVTVMSDAVRALTLGDHAQQYLGHGVGYYLPPALAWAAGIAAVFLALSVLIYHRRNA